MSALAACIASYPVSVTKQWSSKIWDALKFEIWNGDNEDFIQGALDVLRSTVTSLGKTEYDWESPSTAMTDFVVTAATECRSRFHDSKKLYLVSSGRILNTIASGNPYAFHLVARTILPAMHVMWQDLKLPSEKRMLLTVYNYILDARLVQPENNPKHALLVTSFEGFRDGIVEVYFGAMSSIRQESSSSDLSFGMAAVQGLVLLFRIPSYLSAVEQGMIIQELNAILFDRHDNDVCTAVLSSLQKISAMEPETFHDITLTNFIEKLPDTISQDRKRRQNELEVIIGQLQDLVDIACSEPCQRELRDGPPINTASSYWHRNFDAIENKLLKKLDVVLQNGQLEYANVVLAAICGGLQIFDSGLKLARDAYAEPAAIDPTLGPYSYIVRTLFQQVVKQKDDPDGAAYIGIKESVDEKFVQIVGRTAMLALRSHLSTVENSLLFNWNASHPEEPSVIWTLFTPGPHATSLGVWQQVLEKGPADKCLANMLSMYLLAGHLHTKTLAVCIFPWSKASFITDSTIRLHLPYE